MGLNLLDPDINLDLSVDSIFPLSFRLNNYILRSASFLPEWVVSFGTNTLLWGII